MNASQEITSYARRTTPYGGHSPRRVPQGAGGIGGLLARSHGYSSGNWTTHNFYHADGNGNITYMLNSSQAMAASYRYDPFGNPVSSSGTLADANLYRFSSKEIHLASGVYYHLYALRVFSVFRGFFPYLLEISVTPWFRASSSSLPPSIQSSIIHHPSSVCTPPTPGTLDRGEMAPSQAAYLP